MLKCLPLPVTVRGLCCIVYIWAQNWELDRVNAWQFIRCRDLYGVSGGVVFPSLYYFVSIVVRLFQDLYRCDLLDFRTEQNCEANANVGSKASWRKQKSFIWLWWLWSRSAACVFKVVCVYLGGCWGEEEGDICTATYPDFEMFALCNWLRGVFKLPNLGVETTVAFRLKTEKLKLPNLWGAQAPHTTVKRLNLYVYMKQLLSSQYTLQPSWTCF